MSFTHFFLFFSRILVFQGLQTHHKVEIVKISKIKWELTRGMIKTGTRIQGPYLH